MMKRRTFCRYIVLNSAGFAGVVGKNFTFAMSPKSFSKKSRYQWVVLYWMPYDNDLVRFGEPIVGMLTRGTYNSQIAVIVQSDYRDDLKMRRRQLVSGITNEIGVSGEDSSNVSAFSEYLDWANQNFEAEHWAVIVVGHGGKINEISPDDRGKTLQTRTWMGVNQFANAVSNFNQATNGRVELLFFQNCNKAALEVFYEARNSARYTLASQLALGAPNYYYKGFLNSLKEPSVDGLEAAIAIANSERDDMYHTLTLVDNRAIKQIPDKLSRLLQAITINGSLPEIKGLEIPTYYNSDEQHCDLLVLLSHLSKISNKGQNEIAEFTNFLRSSAIAFYKTGGKLYGSENNLLDIKNPEKFCGLSLYIPENAQSIYRYSSFALYQEVNLVNFYRSIIGN
jgi:hypothetical protein